MTSFTLMTNFLWQNSTVRPVCGSLWLLFASLSLAVAQPAAPAPALPPLRLELFAEGYKRPLQIVLAPGSAEELYVVEQGGLVQSLDPDKAKRKKLLDLSDNVLLSESTGLLGFAFHPKYPELRLGYAHYMAKTRDIENRVSEFELTAGGAAGVDAERKLIRIVQKSLSNVGGQIAFGPDDNLYVTIGDGSESNDSEDRGQNANDQLGNILRIGVEEQEGTKQPYLAPVDNPFVASGLGHRDVFATGLRDPRTLSFDSLTRSLWVGDAGNGIEQEINLIRTGGNYGWSVFDGSGCLRMRFECMNQRYQPPVVSYFKQEGTSVVVGGVYHGAALPSEYDGLLFYADKVSGKLWALKYEDGKLAHHSLLLETGKQVSCFGQDDKGDFLLADYKTGNIYRLLPRELGKAPAKPALKSESGK